MLSQQRKAYLRPVVPEAASAGPVHAIMPHVSRLEATQHRVPPGEVATQYGVGAGRSGQDWAGLG